MSVWRGYITPALKYWPLNLEPSTSLKACHLATEGATHIRPAVLESSGPQLSCRYGHQSLPTVSTVKYGNKLFSPI